MALKPRMAVKVLRKDGSEHLLAPFYAKIDQVIGLNADWFLLHVENKNNENDWLIDEIDSLQFRIFVGYTHKPIGTEMDAVIPDLEPMIYGWVGRINATFGSVGKMITIEGGDASFVLNKGYSGDFMARRTPTEKRKPLPDDLLINDSGWGIIKQVTLASNIPGVDAKGHYVTPEGIVLNPSSGFRTDDTLISGATETKYLPDTISDEEEKKLGKKKFYQINNHSKLEVIDDICGKTGFHAWVDPGSPVLQIAKKEEYKQVEINPLKSWGGASVLDEKQKEKGSWIKFKKVPHFENGLQLEIRYWDWQKAVASRHRSNVRYIKDELVTGTAHFLGNPKEDALAIVFVNYEPVDRTIADKRAYEAVNRIVSQRIIATGQVPGNPDLMPNCIVPIEGCGEKWDQKYLCVHTSHVFSRNGYSTLFEVRLPDLARTENDDEIENNPMTMIKVGNYVKGRGL